MDGDTRKIGLSHKGLVSYAKDSTFCYGQQEAIEVCKLERNIINFEFLENSLSL